MQRENAEMGRDSLKLPPPGSLPIKKRLPFLLLTFSGSVAATAPAIGSAKTTDLRILPTWA